MAKKSASELVRMNSTGIKKDGKKTGYFYTTKISKALKIAGKKLRLKRYDPRAWNKETGKFGMHVWFEQGKIK